MELFFTFLPPFGTMGRQRKGGFAMRIAGLQKCTLLDYPGKVACTVFLPGCNFRCPFCHNYELAESPETLMDSAELLAFLRKRQGLLEGVCITGGEPTLQPELPQLLRDIRELGFSVKLDTNGYRPEALRPLLEEKLVDYVAMDLKNGPEDYAATCGLGSMELGRIEESVQLLLEGETDYELRTTVCKPLHSAETIASMAKWMGKISEKRVKRLFLQPFVDRDTVPFDGFSAPEKAELEEFRRILSAAAEHVEIRGIG
jgi:pyruvate formate lyase activating enzyme